MEDVSSDGDARGANPQSDSARAAPAAAAGESEEALPTWEAIGAHLSAGDLPRARAALTKLCDRSPELAEAWINRGALERALGDLESAADHLERGIALLDARAQAADPLLVPACLNLAEVLEALEEVARSAAALRQAFRRAPESPAPLIQLAGLLARAGDLAGARQAARDYCLAAVSILAEKPSIGPVRKFQKALEAADAVDGRLLLIATREACAMAFDAAAWPLRATARFEVPCAPADLAPGAAPSIFDLERCDALVEATGERRALTSSPVYGFPGNAPAAREALFTVPVDLGAPFETRISTRTAWNALALRVRFKDALEGMRLSAAEGAVAAWFKRGFEGDFSLQRDRGFFHAISRPARLGARGLRFEVDLGLANQTAIAALVEALAELHRQQPIECAVLGDGLLG